MVERGCIVVSIRAWSDRVECDDQRPARPTSRHCVHVFVQETISKGEYTELQLNQSKILLFNHQVVKMMLWEIQGAKLALNEVHPLIDRCFNETRLFLSARLTGHFYDLQNDKFASDEIELDDRLDECFILRLLDPFVTDAGIMLLKPFVSTPSEEFVLDVQLKVSVGDTDMIDRHVGYLGIRGRRSIPVGTLGVWLIPPRTWFSARPVV